MSVGNAIGALAKTVKDAHSGLSVLANLLNAIANPFAELVGGPGARKQSLRNVIEEIAPDIRKSLGDDSTTPGLFGLGLVGVDYEKAQRADYRRFVFGLFGLDESGFTPKENKRIEKEAIDSANQIAKDMERERLAILMASEKRLRIASNEAGKAVLSAMRSSILSRHGKLIGANANFRTARLAEQKFMKIGPEEAIEQFPELDPDVQEARMNAEIKMGRRRLDLKFRIEDILRDHIDKTTEHAKRKEVELMEFRFKLAESMTNRAVNDLGFVLFGGRGANARIDAQVAQIKKQIDVMEGVTAPLTRQEELMNRIVELESQRISINERIGSVIRRTLADLVAAVAKAAVLRAMGFGTERRGQSGGFVGLLTAGLNLGTAIVSATSGTPTIKVGGSRSFDVPIDFSSGAPASKMIHISNPVFVGQTISEVVDSASRVSERRVR